MIIWCFMVFILAVNTAYWGKEKGKENLIVMKRRAGEANALLLHEKLLIGCESRTKLHFVYLSLEGCRATFRETFRGSTPPGEKMLHTALLYFSSGYACCVARKHFPFPLPVGTSPGHLPVPAVMSSSPAVLMRLMASAFAVAERAGGIVRDIMKTGDLGIVEKTGANDLQTKADRLVQQCICSSLTRMFPKITIIGEEDLPSHDVEENLIESGQSEEILQRVCPKEYSGVREEEVSEADPAQNQRQQTAGVLLKFSTIE
ncbi:UNVERIFIED_CONTAM: hypothetical protein FKN15_077814 [Acipenser sinensis]